MDRFCRQCGEPISEQDAFCGKCGARIRRAEPQRGTGNKSTPSHQQPTHKYVAKNAPTPRRRRRKKKKSILPVIVLICLLVLLCVLVIIKITDKPTNMEIPADTIKTTEDTETETTLFVHPIEEIDDNKNYPIFNGYYTNNGEYEANETVRKILATIEEDTLINGIPYGNIIYHYVADRSDCFPSAKNPVYYVISDVSNGTVLKTGTYEVMYIIGVGNNVAVDLFFSVSYDFSSVTLIEVTARHLGGSGSIYSYWYEDWSQNEMENAVLMTVSQYMPDIPTGQAEVDSVPSEIIYYSGTVERYENSLSGWRLVLSESATVWDADGSHLCDAFCFYTDAVLGKQAVSEYEGKTITICGTPENYRNGGAYYIYEPILVSVEDVSSPNSITNANFESKVSLTPQENWYDNGIFSSYFNGCNYGSGVTWSYVGSTYDVFSLNYYTDYVIVDVYKISHPDGMSNYYFIPYHDLFGNAPVVFRFLENGQKPVEVWSGLS